MHLLNLPKRLAETAVSVGMATSHFNPDAALLDKSVLFSHILCRCVPRHTSGRSCRVLAKSSSMLSRETPGRCLAKLILDLVKQTWLVGKLVRLALVI